ncbi:MAG: ABC transporter ATP-binding protein [Acidimicrobiales bacterium]
MVDSPPAAVELVGIWKRFPGVIANRDINLRVGAGTIHSLVGENGAGKSTLMKTLYGMHRPDEGTIAINGETVTFRSPTDAIAHGVGMVHQHFMLADNLDVTENIILGAEPTRRGRVDYAGARARLTELKDAYGIELDLEATVEHLGVGERQRVEILKVLFRGARILILDEPTAVLVPQEVDELFANLRHLVAEGVTIIFISHKLDEVLAISDDITVIRDGTTVATVKPADVDKRRLGELMVGSELPLPDTQESTVTPVVELSVRGVDAPATDDDRIVVKGVSFDIHQGEIVGIAGVEGNGQFELVEAILGLRPLLAGSVLLGSTDLAGMDVKERHHAGIGYIPFDRHREALLLGAPLWENMILGHDDSPRFSHGLWISATSAQAECDEAIARFDVATPGNGVPAYALSGGNQQKLIVGREMTAEPSLLIAAHPTRGVDVGAQAAIWDELRRARAAGLAVLLISADLDELIGLSDQLLVMFRGEITARLDPADATPQQLGMFMAGERQEATA